MNRRDFLRYSAAGAATALLPFSARAEDTPRWEGIYTDRFTYRAGVDPLNIHISLLDATSVDVLVIHRDHLPPNWVVWYHTVSVDDTQVPEYTGEPSGGAGIFGPQFPVRISLDTTGLEPGLYFVHIPPASMRPENRSNLSGSGFFSENHHAYFVVTAAVSASYSNLLWVHDCATGTAYGGFGGESIYGGLAAGVPTVSTQRPGLDRTNTGLGVRNFVVKLKTDEYRFEYMDAMLFGLQVGPLPYDLIVICGQFEYLSDGFMANLAAYIETGGNLLVAAHEFAVFRTRIDAAATSLTTYKVAAPLDDPVAGQGQAGVGMHITESIYETEIAGMNTWSAWNTGFTDQDMSITNTEDTGWLFEGTGFDDILPGYINGFCNGNRGLELGNAFNLIDTEVSRTHSDTVVWAAAPSSGAKKWDEALPGQGVHLWPPDPNGYALCTWRETNGARIIGLPQSSSLWKFCATPGYDRMIENIFAYLTSTSSPVPAPLLSPVGFGVLSAALIGAGRAGAKAIRSPKEPGDSGSTLR